MRAGVVLASLLLVGCLAPAKPGPSSCGDLDATRPSGNAPLAAVLREPPAMRW